MKWITSFKKKILFLFLGSILLSSELTSCKRTDSNTENETSTPTEDNKKNAESIPTKPAREPTSAESIPIEESNLIDDLLNPDPAIVKKASDALILKRQNLLESLSYVIKAYELTNGDPRISLKIADIYSQLNEPKIAKLYYQIAVLSNDADIQKSAQEALQLNDQEVLPNDQTENTDKQLTNDEEITTSDNQTENGVDETPDAEASLNKYYELRSQASENTQLARAELERILCINPFYALANLELAYQLLSQKQYGDAISHLISAYEFSNHDPEIALQIAYTYDNLQETDKAEVYYQVALTSSNPEIRRKATRTLDATEIQKNDIPSLDTFYEYLGAEDFEKALVELKQILCKYPSNAPANLEMAYLLLKENQNKEALLYLISAYEGMNHDASVALQIGYTFNDLQEFELSEVYFKEALGSPDLDVQSKAKEALKSHTTPNNEKDSETNSTLQTEESPSIQELTPQQEPEPPKPLEDAPIPQEEVNITSDDDLSSLDKSNTELLSTYYDLRAANKFPQAKIELENALAHEPKNPVANLEMAYFLIETHKDAESLPYFLKAYEFSEEDPRTALEIGYLYTQYDDPKLAIPFFEKAALSPDEEIAKPASEALKNAKENVLHPSLNTYYDLKNEKEHKKAQDELQRILELDPTYHTANLEMGYHLLNEHKEIEALAFFLKAYESTQDPDIALEVGTLYEDLNLLEDAKRYYELAVESKDTEIKEKAEESITRVNDKFLHPTLTFYYELQKAKQYSESHDELERVLNVDPDSNDAHIEMGYHLLNAQKKKESIPHFLKSYELSQDHEIGLQLAHVYDEIHDLENAKHYFELASLSDDPDIKKEAEEGLKRVNEELLHPSLAIYYQLKEAHKLKGARAEIERILKVDPNSKAANLEMAYLLIPDHKQAESIPYLKKAYEVDKDPQIALEIAYAYEVLEHHDLSERYFHLAALGEDPEVKINAEKALEEKSIQLGGRHGKTSIFHPFMDFYSEATLYSRFSNWVSLMDAKIGLNIDECQNDQLYLQMRYVQDTRSKSADCSDLINPINVNQGFVGEAPIVLDDPLFLVAGGYRHRFFKNHGLYAYITLGIAYDLIYRLRSINRGDLRAGVNYYGDWDKEAILPHCSYCFNHIGNYYFDFSYYSRYRYWIGYSTLKEGVRLIDRPCSQINAYVRLFGAVDTKGEYFNNVVEIGPYLEVIPLKPFPIQLAAYWVQGFYYRNGGTSKNPYGPAYTDFRIQGTVSTSF